MNFDERRKSGVEAIDSLLRPPPLSARKLTTSELAPYRDRRVAEGWRVRVTFPDQSRSLDVLVGPNFPREPALIALVDRPEFLTWPHVEKDGVLCLLPSTTEVDHAAPAEVTASALGDACELIEQLVRGERKQDFQTEFLSYWGWATDRWRRDIWSLLRPEGPSRHIHYWPAKGFYLLAETPEQLSKWLGHYVRGTKADPAKILTGTLLWLQELPAPTEYPKVAGDLLGIAKSLGCPELLDHHLKSDEASLVILGGNSGVGPCFAATLAPEAPQNLPPKGKRRSRLEDGFRSNRVPLDLLRARRFGSAAITRVSVDRADAAWIHGRDQDPHFRKMKESTVTLIGCGSLGAHVAVRLAEAGVGQLNLVDPQPLQWPNIGRHPLSAQQVGSSKAEELAKVLRQQYPHARDFRSSTSHCEELLSENSDFLTDCHLVIATMGNWAAEGALNAWHLRFHKPVPVLYAWTEPHAVAGHAVAIVRGGPCFQCGFRNNGEPKFRVGEWTKETTHMEPGCGAVFQPYGPVEFTHIVALTAEAAIDCLLGIVPKSTHRIWCGRRSLLDATSGRWTPEWTQLAGSRTPGGFVEERPWLPDSHCSECGRVDA